MKEFIKQDADENWDHQIKKIILLKTLFEPNVKEDLVFDELIHIVKILNDAVEDLNNVFALQVGSAYLNSQVELSLA